MKNKKTKILSLLFAGTISLGFLITAGANTNSKYTSCECKEVDTSTGGGLILS